MKKISLNSDSLKMLVHDLEPHISHFAVVVLDKIQNPKRLGVYFATAVLGFSASRFISSIIVYILSSELHGMANPANAMFRTNETRKEASSANIDLASVIDGVFFKRPVVEAVTTQTGAPAVNFSLIGTLEGDPAFSRAVIRINGVQEDPKEYALGEKIGNAVLIVIGYEKIWVRENGVKYKVEVGESSQDAQSKANTPTADGGAQTKVLSRQEINDKILGNPEAMYGGGAAFGPNLENGKITGFKLHRIPENHIFYSLGARTGDIIKSVNGYALSNTGQMMELWNNIKTMPRVSVDIIRDGKPMRFDFEIRN
jgi:type II secretion system protein C